MKMGRSAADFRGNGSCHYDRVFSAIFVSFSCGHFAFFARCDAFFGPKNRAFVRCLHYSIGDARARCKFQQRVVCMIAMRSVPGR